MPTGCAVPLAAVQMLPPPLLRQVGLPVTSSVGDRLPGGLPACGGLFGLFGAHQGGLAFMQGVELLSHDSKGSVKRVKAEDALNGKTVGIYFSASWCPPCHAFTPHLAR